MSHIRVCLVIFNASKIRTVRPPARILGIYHLAITKQTNKNKTNKTMMMYHIWITLYQYCTVSQSIVRYY
jgi:hypothetical protein